MKYDYVACAKRHGEIEYKGKKYALVADATLTNRAFTNCWSDAEIGEEYTAEFSAKVIDADGEEYEAYWQFDAVKGEEPEDDGEWPWDNKNITRVEAR